MKNMNLNTYKIIYFHLKAQQITFLHSWYYLIFIEKKIEREKRKTPYKKLCKFVVVYSWLYCTGAYIFHVIVANDMLIILYFIAI